MTIPFKKYLLLTITGGLLFLNSCVTVHQIDRARLAKPMMQLEPLPHQSAFADEIHTIREGAAGASGASAGGGCGCN